MHQASQLQHLMEPLTSPTLATGSFVWRDKKSELGTSCVLFIISPHSPFLYLGVSSGSLISFLICRSLSQQLIERSLGLSPSLPGASDASLPKNSFNYLIGIRNGVSPGVASIGREWLSFLQVANVTEVKHGTASGYLCHHIRRGCLTVKPKERNAGTSTWG